MATLVDLVQADVDWIGDSDIPESERDDLYRIADRSLSSAEQLASPRWAQVVILDEAPGGKQAPGPRLTFGDRVFNELHDFLCTSSTTYERQRSEISEKFRIGEAGLVAALTTAVTPYIGASAIIVAPGIALSLTIIGHAGLNAWCAAQRDRRARHEHEVAQFRERIDDQRHRNREGGIAEHDLGAPSSDEA
jgi:hypothetical protein